MLSAHILTGFAAIITSKFIDTNIAQPIGGVISNIFGNIGAEKVSLLGKNIYGQLIHRLPDQINHDLQKAVLLAIDDSLRAIKAVYKKQEGKLSQQDKKFIKSLKDYFLKNFSPENGFTLQNEELKKLLYNPDIPSQQFLRVDGQDILTKNLTVLLDSAVKNEIISAGFAAFCKERFIDYVQLYFAEILKSDDHPKARRAMERMLAEETLNGINQILAQKDNFLQPYTTPAFSEIENSYKKEFDVHFVNLTAKLEKIGININDVKTIINQEARISKTRHRFIVVLLSISVMGIGFILYIISSKSTQTQFNIKANLVRDNRVNKNYPEMYNEGKIVLHLHTGKIEQKKIDGDGLAIFTDIDTGLKGKKVKAELIDNTWRLATDSIELNENIQLSVLPLDQYRIIEGTVRNQFSKAPVSGVIIEVENVELSTQTDTNGHFKLTMPYKSLAPYYRVLYRANGYYNGNEFYNTGADPITKYITPNK